MTARKVSGAAISAMALSVAMANAMPSYAVYSNRCAESSAVPETVNLDYAKEASFYWNGTVINSAKLMQFLRDETAQAKSRKNATYFLWSNLERPAPPELVALLKKYGFVRHQACRGITPIP